MLPPDPFETVAAVHVWARGAVHVLITERMSAMTELTTSSRSLRSMPFNREYHDVSVEDVRRVHEAALAILERTGVRVPGRQRLSRMADAGCIVDFEAERVRMPPEFVQAMVDLAPAHFELGARDPALALHLDGNQGWLCTDGCPAYVVDLDSGERRYSTIDDLAQITRLADALPEIGLLGTPVSGGDAPSRVRPLYEVRTQLGVTTKHINNGTAVDGPNARGVLEMCRAIVGSSEALRERSPVSGFQCCISPLLWDEGALEAMAAYAEAGVPVGICSFPIACATGPATTAGTMALAHAEIVSGIAILQTMVPGAKVFYANYASTMDLVSGDLNAAWGPDDMHIGSAQLSRHLEVPNMASFASPGAKYPDWHAGVQDGFTALSQALMPTDMVCGAGGLFNAGVCSLPALLLDCELWEEACRWAEGCTIDDEHFALDVIDEVGPGGHFLASQHTRDHMRDQWRSRYLDQGSWEAWEEAGRPDPVVAATAEVRRILAEHEPEPLDEALAAELDAIVASYERQAVDDDE